MSYNIKRSFIEETFNQLKIGNVLRIDMILKKTENNEKFYSVFIYIDWNDSDLSKHIVDRINAGKDIKIIYDNFLFWKVFINKSTKQKDYLKEKKSFSFDSREKDLWERNKKIV
jgi:hypothetical protein